MNLENLRKTYNRIPTSDNPLDEQFLKPVIHFLNQWIDDPTFYQDFIYACPFNYFLIEHFNDQPRINSLPDTWDMLFEYLATNYSAIELADLIYEVLHFVDQAEKYLEFLLTNKYDVMWPTGENFSDPFLEKPQKQAFA